MSGHCDFCQTWHSGFCCHPGRASYDLANAEIATLRAEVERLRAVLAPITTGLCVSTDDLKLALAFMAAAECVLTARRALEVKRG